MKVVQVNAISKIRSTGRIMMELSEYLNSKEIINYQVHPEGFSQKNSYIIGNKIDYKLHAILSRITGLQGYFSTLPTKRLLMFFDEINPDVVHLHNVHSNFINLNLILNYCTIKNIKLVLTLHDSWFYSARNLDYDIDMKFLKSLKINPRMRLGQENRSYFFDNTKKIIEDRKKILQENDRIFIVGVSKWISDQARKSNMLQEINFDNIKTVYNWVNLEMFKPISNINFKSFNFSKDRTKNKFVIVCVASEWNKFKGIDLILELVDKLPTDMLILLVGKTDYNLKRYQNLIHIEETNNIDDLVQLYNIADVCLNISIAESFGQVTAEALACGTPVIVSNSTASPELIIENETGKIINDLNTENILEALLVIQKKSKSYYTNKCRSFAEEKFSYTHNANKYLEIYKMPK